MSEPAVFVTGATGIVGSAVVRHLLNRDVPVIAAVRSTTDALALPAGAAVRQFDFDSTPAELTHALVGADRLFLMRPPPIENVARYLFPLIDAAQKANIRQIVFLSLQGVQSNRKTPHHAVEKYLRQQNVPYTFLRPNFFMQNLSTTYAQRIRDQSEIFVPAGRSHTAFVDARDIGRVAASVFTEPGHLRKAYTLSGEQSLSYSNIADIMTDVLARPIRYSRPSEAEYLAELAAEGRPTAYIDVQKMIYRVVRWNISALPNRTIRKLTGTPATTFREFAHDSRHTWQ
ncbi:SDR family oxidoreductase [Cryobacterium melibiosiphilum]|uniref:SDR family oxidoreductase n=1 Tax=Cryobacterium melibiosiphilum TaxID=995039 RepID=A0A3A5MPY1_9MICO|nr:SDR family oxidoreductase [Cryobacterium melibiosiphilum]RJT92160.1 SDR family oxidoreductase [Cryobacterium melibiosiphilum]